MVEAQEPVSEGDPKPFSKVHATSIHHIDDHEAYNILELEFHSFCSRIISRLVSGGQDIKKRKCQKLSQWI